MERESRRKRKRRGRRRSGGGKERPAIGQEHIDRINSFKLNRTESNLFF